MDDEECVALSHMCLYPGLALLSVEVVVMKAMLPTRLLIDVAL